MAAWTGPPTWAPGAGAGAGTAQGSIPAAQLSAALAAGRLPLTEEPNAKRQRMAADAFGNPWAGSLDATASGGACGSCAGCGSFGLASPSASSAAGYGTSALGAAAAAGCGSWGGAFGAAGACGNWQMQAQLQMAQMQAMAMSSQTLPAQQAEEKEEERFVGFIRDYNESQGFGFVECEQARLRWGMDVFIHRRQMFGLSKGDEVSFVVIRNGQGQPQARHVIKKEETERILQKRKQREAREVEQLKAKKQSAQKVFTPAANEGRVMSEAEAIAFQKSLKRGR